MKTFSHASLFSGIGGFDLAAEWMGWENIFSCDINKFSTNHFNNHFPTKHYGDIRSISGREFRGGCDIVTGGFPCQPFSSAGKRMGRDDDRHLWGEMLRVIQEVQPTWVVAENVRGIITIENGMVFEQVCIDLEADGYEVQPLCIPACAVDAIHRRDRFFFIANNESKRRKKGCIQKGKHGACPLKTQKKWSDLWIRSIGVNIVEFRKEDEPFICGMDDGIPDRVDRLTALGNAIVPQVAYEIFKAIEYAELSNNKQ